MQILSDYSSVLWITRTQNEMWKISSNLSNMFPQIWEAKIGKSCLWNRVNRESYAIGKVVNANIRSTWQNSEGSGDEEAFQYIVMKLINKRVNCNF